MVVASCTNIPTDFRGPSSGWRSIPYINKQSNLLSQDWQSPEDLPIMLDSSTKHKREGDAQGNKDKSKQIAKAKGTNEPEKEKRMRTEKQRRNLYKYILLWAEKMGFGKLPTATHLGFKKPL